MKQSVRTLTLFVLALGVLMFTGCLGGASSATLVGADKEAALDSGAVVKNYYLLTVDSTTGVVHAYDLKAVIRTYKDPRKAIVTLKGDTNLKVMQVGSYVDTSSTGVAYLTVWINGRFDSLETTSMSPIERGVPNHVRTSPEGSAFRYQLSQTTEEQRTSNLIGTTTVLVEGALEEPLFEPVQQISGNNNVWYVSLRFEFKPFIVPSIPVACCKG